MSNGPDVGRARRDLSPGDRVALMLPGSQLYLDTVISLLARGIFPVPLDPRLTATEADRILKPLEVAEVVRDSDRLEQLIDPASVRGLPLGRPMHCTSGTTGRPKGVDSGLLSPDLAEALLLEERTMWGFTGDDVNLVMSPLHHSAPLRFAMGTLLAGGGVVLPGQTGPVPEVLRASARSLEGPTFDPAIVTQAIETARPTTMFCVPTHLQRLFAHWDAHGWPNLSCFRLVAHAGAPCPEPVKRRLIEVFPPDSTWEFYGASEGQFTACRSEEWLQRPGTVGRARPGRRLATDEDGTIWCAVPEHARFTYAGDPEKTAAAWRVSEDGRDEFTVWDAGRLDEDGYLYLDGRRSDLIISGGVNVYPMEVEQILGTHPDVADIAVVGLPDAQWGQRVVAAVVSGSAHDPAESLDGFARAHLAPPKRPKQYVVVDELPRNATGKVLRDRVVDRLAQL